MELDQNYIKAKERVKELKKFYSSLTIFIIVNLFLILCNYMTNGLSYPWFLWVTVWWGIAIAIHGLKVFGFNLILSKDWEERKIKEIMEKGGETYNKEAQHKWE